jgi:hypothetical protein
MTALQTLSSHVLTCSLHSLHRVRNLSDEIQVYGYHASPEIQRASQMITLCKFSISIKDSITKA